MTNEQLATLLVSYIARLDLVEEVIRDNIKGTHLIQRDEVYDLILPLHTFTRSLHEDRKRLTGEKC